MAKPEIRVLDERIRELLPSYATDGAAGLDLRACIEEPRVIAPGETFLVPTGIAMHLKDPAAAAILLPRSGLGHKNGIVLGNLVGLIDSDYQGEVKASIWNRSDTPFTINPLDRVCQMVVIPVIRVEFDIVDEFDISDRGDGGFGSTGSS